MRIEIALYDGFDELDAIGPFEVLAGVGPFDVALVTLGAARTVTAAHGARIEAHATLADRPDLLVVPGGGWNDRRPAGARAEVDRGELPAAIAARHARGTRLASVCTGAMLLAAAGLLRGRPAVTHHGAIGDLRAAGARVMPDARVVDDGDIVTAGGITSGIDLALWIVERELGADAAKRAAGELEYTRDPRIWRASSLSADGR